MVLSDKQIWLTAKYLNYKNSSFVLVQEYLNIFAEKTISLYDKSNIIVALMHETYPPHLHARTAKIKRQR